MAKKELETLVSWFDSFESSTQDARKLAERDRDYYDGRMWTDAEISQLKKRGQPVVTLNRIAPKIDFVLGMEIQSRTDPKAYPRNPGTDEKAAQAATDALRFLADRNVLDQEVSRAGANLLIEGICGGEVFVEQAPNGGIDIKMRWVPWDRLWFDPRSRYEDFSDAKYMGMILWMDLEDAQALYPGKEDFLSAGQFNDRQSMSETFDDRPRTGVWFEANGDRPRVKICQVWYRAQMEPNGPPVWYTATYTQAGFLVDPMYSPYLDEDGLTVPGMLLQSAKIDRENNRYGMVRHLISPQDEINKRRSKALHLLNMRQTISERGSVEDLRQAKQELAKPDGHIVVNPGARFDILPTTDMTQGHFTLLAEAKAEIDAIGANAALTGKEPRTLSGRAIQAKQQGGFIELTPFIDALKQWKLRMYKASWLRIKQFWTEEKWFRVLDSEANLKFVGLNRPIRAIDVLAERGVQITPEQMAQLTEEQQAELQQVVGKENDASLVEVDVLLSESRDLVTLAHEQFEQLAELAGQGLPIPPEMLIAASSLRNKDQLLRMLQTGGLNPQQQQQQQQQQQMAQQVQMKGVELDLRQKAANVGKTEAETARTMLQAGQTQADIQQKQSEAGEKALKSAADELTGAGLQ